MSGLTFEGDLAGATNVQKDFIKETLNKLGYKDSTVVVEPVGKAGDNFIASVKRITVNENGKIFKMVAKLAPENPVFREKARIGYLFECEHAMYMEILPKFEGILKSANVPENERFRFAKCYGSLNEAPNEVILLEDLKEDNFEIMNRFEPLTDDNVKMVLRNFAVYHSMSYVVKHHEPETYKTFQKLLSSNAILSMFTDNPDLDLFLSLLESTVTENAEARCVEIVKRCLKDIEKTAISINEHSENNKYACIQHGDAWTNNIMFRYENHDPIECTLVDYQMVKENCPVYDIMYLIFNSTSHKQRSQHFHEYIHYYHDELDKSLKNFGLRANQVYPIDILYADLKIYGKLILAISVFITILLSKSTNEAEKLKKYRSNEANCNELDEAIISMRFQSDKSKAFFKEKIADLVDSFCDFNLL